MSLYTDAEGIHSDEGLVRVFSKTVTLTNAQIKALPTTAVEIVPAPGANRIVYPFGAFLHLNWIADYTNIDADAQIKLVVLSSDLLIALREDTQSQVTSLLAGGGPDGTNALTGVQFLKKTAADVFSGNSGFYDSDIMNKSVVLSAYNGSSGNFTGGNVGNSLQATVLYTVIDV